MNSRFWMSWREYFTQKWFKILDDQFGMGEWGGLTVLDLAPLLFGRFPFRVHAGGPARVGAVPLVAVLAQNQGTELVRDKPALDAGARGFACDRIAHYLALAAGQEISAGSAIGALDDGAGGWIRDGELLDLAIRALFIIKSILFFLIITRAHCQF